MQELMKLMIWVCCKFCENKGRRTKTPISVDGTPTGTNAAYAHTWVTYEKAKRAAEKNGYDGVGFIIPKGYFFLDIDHKALSDPYVQSMLKRFNSYAEKSVSGEGLHIYGRCDLGQIPIYTDGEGIVHLAREFYTKNSEKGIELYIGGITNRYAVYTGDAVTNEPIHDCTQAVLTTLDKDMRRNRKVKDSTKRDGNKQVFDIVCNLRKQKNGEKFSKLYDRGDFSDYASQSEADAALCALIAFRTGSDPAAIDKIFRSSRLYREKWEREDYREKTISAGIESCHGTFYRSRTVKIAGEAP